MDPADKDRKYKKLSAFQDQIPGHRTNARVHLSTLLRWCLRGVRLPDGSRVKLQAVRVGSRWFTTDVWFDEFIATLTAAHTGCDKSPVSQTPVHTHKTQEAVERELDALGVGPPVFRRRPRQSE